MEPKTAEALTEALKPVDTSQPWVTSDGTIEIQRDGYTLVLPADTAKLAERIQPALSRLIEPR